MHAKKPLSELYRLTKRAKTRRDVVEEETNETRGGNTQLVGGSVQKFHVLRIETDYIFHTAIINFHL